ncbi:hypothetical protein SLS60_000215 [Paraconiothyrium brasiliense]|uniref:Major facilitator superfamily (MFS) profile domain-containing protein n=1 Tax=Paraconiothyrium brasiliense TaxID=300254 RepID=A0ABR3S5S2_9PLEO
MVRPTSTEKIGVRRLAQCFNFRLAYSCAIIAISQINFGLDQGVFSNMNALDSFIKKFGGVQNSKTHIWSLPGSYLSLLNSLTYIGFAFGLVTGNILSGKLGRRKCFLIMCVWAEVGGIVLITSQNRWQMVVGRVIAYVYIGMELALVPVLQSELTPAPARGFIVGTYQSSLLLGQLIGALVIRGTSTLSGEKAFRIPLGLLFVIPTLLFCGIWYVPESPRWLLAKGREDEAMHSLRLLRQGKFTDEEIEAEFHEFRSTLNITVEKGRFLELFQGTNLKRTLIVVGVNFFLQLTGQNFASVYGTVFIKSTGVIEPFTMSAINTSVGIVAVLLCQFLTDYTGRVPLMLLGAVFQSCALFVMGGLGTASSPTLGMRIGIVAMLTLYIFSFSLGWAPLSHVVAAEIPTQHLRDKTYALGAVFNIAVQFAVSFSIPYLINAEYANLGGKVGFIFGTTAVFAALFTWFCIPECSSKSLEEIDELFLEGVGIREFGKSHTTAHVEVLNEGATEKGVISRVEQLGP